MAKKETQVEEPMAPEATKSFMGDIKRLAEQVKEVDDPEAAKTIIGYAESIIAAVQTEGFWASSKEVLANFWNRVTTRLGDLRDWVTDTIRFVVDGVVATFRFVVDIISRIIDGIAGFVTGALTMVFGDGEIVEEEAVAQAA